MRVLITGGAGFIGSHFIKYVIEKTDWSVVCVDKLSYASRGWLRLKQFGVMDSPRLKCVTWDLARGFTEGMTKELGNIDIIIHMAAETHVDRSIIDPVGVIENNVMSTVHILEFARKLKSLKVFQYFSTDEIYGPAPLEVSYKEWDPHRPTNPYSASKAASEDICLAYQNTYKLPVLVTNLMNAYATMQYPEKYIPVVIRKVLNDETITIHTEPDGKTPGSRFYIHANNIVSAMMFILENGKPGEKYNIRGEEEVDNLVLAQKIAKIMGRELKYELVAHHTSRPGHDTRYCLDGSKLYAMGWKPAGSFDESLKETVEWTMQHPEWIHE